VFVGTFVEIANPQTGILINMEVVDTESGDGAVLCKAVVEIDAVDETESGND